MKSQNEQEFTKLADQLERSPVRGNLWEKTQAIIADLRNNEYHDFANEKYATPKMQMIADFTAIGRQDIVDRVKRGDFDQ